MNEYDLCVGNEMINGNQMSVTWHVNDLKASHKDRLELTKLALFSTKMFGDKMTVNQGDVHDCLGMDLDKSNKRVLQMNAVKHLEKSLLISLKIFLGPFFSSIRHLV